MGWMLLIVTVLGCGSPRNAIVDAPPVTADSPEQPTADAAADAFVDASVPGDGTVVPVDAATDAQVDAPPGTVCAPDPSGVTLASHAATQVIVHDATGAPTCRLALTPTSTPQLPVPPNGMITLVSGDPDLLTITALQPGDIVRARPRLVVQHGALAIQFVDVPGATQYRLLCRGVASTTSPLTTNSFPGTCVGNDQMAHDVLVAVDAANAILAFTEIGPLDPTQLGTVVAGAWRTELVTRTLTVANVPPDLASSLRTSIGITLAGVPVGAIGGAGPTLTTTHPAVGDGISYAVTPTSGELATWVDYRVVSPATTTIAYDIATDALARVTSVTPSGLAARPTIAWTTSKPIDRGTHLVAGADWAPGTFGQKQWKVIVPVTTASPVVFPELFPDLQPPGAITDRSLFIFDADNSSYARVKEFPLESFRLPGLQTERLDTRWSLSVDGDFDPI